MKRILASIVIGLTSSAALAGTCQTQLIVQPILAHGGAESWGGELYRIVDVPFLKWHYQGHPAYEAIAQTNTILTDASRRERVPESNLLAFMGINIGYDFAESKLWLHLTSAQEIEGWSVTVEEAAFVALECIRRVAVRYEHKPTVFIKPIKGKEQHWKAVQERFAVHDFTQPFKAQQDGVDQPAAAPKSKSEGKEKTKPESEGRPR